VLASRQIVNSTVACGAIGLGVDKITTEAAPNCLLLVAAASASFSFVHLFPSTTASKWCQCHPADVIGRRTRIGATVLPRCCLLNAVNDGWCIFTLKCALGSQATGVLLVEEGRYCFCCRRYPPSLPPSTRACPCANIFCRHNCGLLCAVCVLLATATVSIVINMRARRCCKY
jgi:hypothetical protein